jgi:dCMP deaminase
MSAARNTPVDLIAQAARRFARRPVVGRVFHGDRGPDRDAVQLRAAARGVRDRRPGGERKNRLVAAGYNGFLPGTPHVSRVRAGHEQATVHAEQNAVADAARRGSPVEGCIAYVTHYPCVNCAKMLAAAGIAEVRYRSDYHNDPLVGQLMADAGVKIQKL